MTRFPLEPTRIHVSDEVLDDLRARLALTRPPLDEGDEDWFYGVPDSHLRELVTYWRDGYDWRQAEAAINAYEHYQMSVAGVSCRHRHHRRPLHHGVHDPGRHRIPRRARLTPARPSTGQGGSVNSSV